MGVATLDWHADRSWLNLLDAAPESIGIDLAAVRGYRLGRVRSEMAERNIAAVVLSDPVNIRYATGTRNTQVFSLFDSLPAALCRSPSMGPRERDRRTRRTLEWRTPAEAFREVA